MCECLCSRTQKFGSPLINILTVARNSLIGFHLNGPEDVFSFHRLSMSNTVACIPTVLSRSFINDSMMSSFAREYGENLSAG
jgi:hypothetical protein